MECREFVRMGRGRIVREQRKKKSRRRSRGSHGIITVFVTLMMVPVVAVTGIMVDVARLKLYSSQAVMAADAYGDGILSEFDNLLKELYGLFSLTQNQEGLEAIDSLTEQMGLSFNPNGDGKSFSGFMPYKDADVKLSYEKVPGASLSNNNVLMTQISDFMKYRVIQEVLEEEGILGTLLEFDGLDSEMDAMKSRNEITDSCSEALGKIDDYYQELKKLAAYPEYLEGREAAFVAYSGKLREIAESDGYEKYVEYLEDKEAIDAAKEKYDRIAEGGSGEEKGDGSGDEGESDSGTQGEESEEMTPEELELAEKYVDEESYKQSLKEQLTGLRSAAENNSGDPIDFYNTEETIKSLHKAEKKLEKTLKTLEEQLAELNAQMEGCSEDVREKLEEEIRDLEKITDLADDFKETYRLIEEVHEDTVWNSGNQQLMEDEVLKLNAVMDNLLEGKVRPEDHWAKTIPVSWYDFQDDKADFYRQLKEICEAETGGEKDKKAGDKEKEKAEKARKEAEDSFKKDEETNARDISAELASQLGVGGGTGGEVPSLSDYFSAGLSFESLSRAGSRFIDRFLLAFYDFGMFSSRVSGTRPEGEEAPAEGDSGEYADYSLTKVKMSRDVNYLYGAELEYLLGGYNSSKSNLNQTRNVICGVRLTMNFLSSYTVGEVNDAIVGIANAAASTVAATGIGVAAAPLVRVAVSGALRLAFATMETAADWKSLKERKSVVLLKMEFDELEALDTLKGLLGDAFSKNGTAAGPDKKHPSLTYEDYLFVLICLAVDDNTLLSRTSNLITLNVNQAMNEGAELTNLDFKMTDTVTAVNATCKIKSDFAVLPDNILELYLKGTDTESLIHTLENQYFGYSVIRGY